MKEHIIKFVEDVGVTAPEACVESLRESFKDAQSVEWLKTSAGFEAIFYKNNQEYIALFEPTGKLLEYRYAISDEYLPGNIFEICKTKGEIMNRVLLNRGNELLYEIIYRDKDLNRFMFVITDYGEIVSHRPL